MKGDIIRQDFEECDVMPWLKPTCGHIGYYQAECCNKFICLECDKDITGIILKRQYHG